MEIKTLGTGCPKCKTLEKVTLEVVEQNGIESGYHGKHNGFGNQCQSNGQS